jgi:hypothetical protein
MKILDLGHDYLLDSYDGEVEVRITFVKRNNPPEKYPGNSNAYPGTQMQDVLRVLLDRCKYVNFQSIVRIGTPCQETDMAISMMRHIIWILESRVRRVRKQPPLNTLSHEIEKIEVCRECGHILCLDHGVLS